MAQDWPGWPNTDADRYRAAGYWAGHTFDQLLTSWSVEHGDRTALVDGERRFSYAALEAEVDRVARGLRGLGVTRGDRFIVQLPNIAEFVIGWFALQRVGAVPVHAMPAHRAAEIEHLARLSGAVGYFIADRHARFDYRELAAEVRKTRQDCAESLKHVIVIGDPGEHDFVSFADLAERGGPTATGPTAGTADSGDLALLLLSGGTTGLPKLIPRTHDDYAYNARASAEVCGLTRDSVFLSVLPIGFNLLNYTRLDDPDELRCTTQGVPLSPDDEIRVVDEQDNPVPDGEPGELLTRGPYTLRGYYRAAEHNARSFTPDGFYRTGDLVRRLPSGHLIVVGRVKDQINRGGEKIPSTEVEGHLLAHPAVKGAALVGQPDAVFGEVPVAFLVCHGQSPTLREVTAFLKERGLAPYKLPTRLVLVEEFPHTAVGKIDKKALAARLDS
ncbi:(2,3-dihydroxybenzoyl)adenylate synthase [Saccharopolyspora spinosa]|uniref:(2,3-dihydroxybenzoyl)adenylate synthase n=1 Tax=Saccharopolyspora spinosa TaxID=60894 RepID=UPI000237A269|nr:AMP-binding protein [Saccharopolyspora spinosa]